MEAVYNPTHPVATDETTAGVCQPQEWRKPGIHEQTSQPGHKPVHQSASNP